MNAGAPAVKAEAPSVKAFNGDFLSLKLSEVENLSGNTKRFRFELPEPNMVSGLPVASAVVTKYKGPNDEKPVIRPYTPTSDEGAFSRTPFLPSFRDANERRCLQRRGATSTSS